MNVLEGTKNIEEMEAELSHSEGSLVPVGQPEPRRTFLLLLHSIRPFCRVHVGSRAISPGGIALLFLLMLPDVLAQAAGKPTHTLLGWKDYGTAPWKEDSPSPSPLPLWSLCLAFPPLQRPQCGWVYVKVCVPCFTPLLMGWEGRACQHKTGVSRAVPAPLLPWLAALWRGRRVWLDFTHFAEQEQALPSSGDICGAMMLGQGGGSGEARNGAPWRKGLC